MTSMRACNASLTPSGGCQCPIQRCLQKEGPRETWEKIFMEAFVGIEAVAWSVEISHTYVATALLTH